MTWVTFFSDVYATALQGEELSLEQLFERIHDTQAPSKAALPLLKHARFGSLRSAQNSLRHDANVTAITGIEGDYDGEQMPFAEAVRRLEAFDVAFIAYTSPSHTPSAPRWRVLLPLSAELEPSHRTRLTDGLNGILGGTNDQGYPWWLSPSLEAIARQFQDAYVEEDPWDDRILDALDRRHPLDPQGNRPPFTLSDVLSGVGLCLEPGQPNCAGLADIKRAGRRLRRLGFRPHPHRSRATGRARFWVSG